MNTLSLIFNFLHSFFIALFGLACFILWMNYRLYQDIEKMEPDFIRQYRHFHHQFLWRIQIFSYQILRNAGRNLKNPILQRRAQFQRNLSWLVIMGFAFYVFIFVLFLLGIMLIQ